MKPIVLLKYFSLKRLNAPSKNRLCQQLSFDTDQSNFTADYSDTKIFTIRYINREMNLPFKEITETEL